MKNMAFSKGRQPETVAPQDLISAMVENYEYTLDEILNLMDGSPRAAVRDTLHALVEKGVVWRNATSHSRVKYALLEGDALREAVERKTTRAETPAWMRNSLTGYDAKNKRLRELCMTVRK
jgi:DNA-binding HxlR family transcriptional regulator